MVYLRQIKEEVMYGINDYYKRKMLYVNGDET